MSARLPYIVQEADGDGIPSLVITLHRTADDTLLDTLTEVGTGEYWMEHNITEKCTLKIGGVAIAGMTGFIFVADDLLTAAVLASTANSEGASLIGIEDASTRFTGSNLETVLGEMPTSDELASQTSGKGASLIGVQDASAYYTGVTVEAVLAEIGTIMSLLNGLTANAAELNKLDGASANVTAANLNTLTAGATSDADALHTHETLQLTTIWGKTTGGARSDIEISTEAISGNTDGGDVLINTSPSGTGLYGAVQIRTSDGNYDVVSRWDTGDFDYAGTFSGNAIDPADPSALKRMLLAMDGWIQQLAGLQWPGSDTVWRTLWQSNFSETPGTVTTNETLPLTDFDFVYAQTTAAIIKRIWLAPTDNLFYELQLRFYAKVSAGSATVTFTHVSSGTAVAVTVSATTDTWHTSDIITLNQSFANPEEFTIDIKCAGGTTLTIYDNLLIQARP